MNLLMDYLGIIMTTNLEDLIEQHNLLKEHSFRLDNDEKD